MSPGLSRRRLVSQNPGTKDRLFSASMDDHDTWLAMNAGGQGRLLTRSRVFCSFLLECSAKGIVSSLEVIRTPSLWKRS
jgi:hypothetical protein